MSFELIYLLKVPKSKAKTKVIGRAIYGCENLISNLTEMISMVLYTFELGDSEFKMGQKIASVSRLLIL